MTINSILKEGLKTIRKNYQLLILFWSTNAAMAVILSLPIYSLLIDNLQHSLLSSRLPLQIDYLWYSQFMNIYSGTIDHLPLLTYSIVALYAIIQTFYFGGMVAVFYNREKNHISDFFYGGVRYWYRFMKVMIISLILFAIGFKLNDLLGDLFTWLFSNYEYYLTDFVLRSLRYVLLIAFIGIVTIISDYAKVGMAIEGHNKVFLSIRDTLRFLKVNFKISVSLFLIISVLGAAGSVVYNIIDNFMPRSPFYLLILSFVLQQMLIIFRLAIRMLFCSTEVVIYSDSKAELVSPDVKESTVGVR